MATYEYDEAGVMAAYFLITFLALVLVPLTISVFTTRSVKIKDGCGCPPCIEQRNKLSKQERGSIFVPKFSSKIFFLLGGWSFFAFVCYRASLLKVENKIYNPFEILGINTNTPDKDVKSHFKKLSRMYHPDKVKVTANLTIEAIQERFVELTKAYKSLTDEKIKENWIKYNHPDGPQTTTMGIALPKWIIEGKNNIWVLGVYGLVFGGALPALVGRWWFGSRQKTKDGINARSAAAFFKSIKEESSMEEVVGTLGKAYTWELPVKVRASDEVDQLEKAIEGRLGSKWTEVRKLAQDYDGQLHKLRREALILLYSHLLRLDIQDAALQKRQKNVLLQTPLLLNALLNVSTARNWLFPSLFVMRLQAYLAQALPPTAADNQCFTQLPGIGYDEIHKIAPKAKDMAEFLRSLEEKEDPRVNDVKKAMERWGHVEIVDAAFKVIGESIVTPSSIVFLLVKLRISPPGVAVAKDLSVEETKRLVQANDKIDEQFLTSRQDAEDLDASSMNGSAHAPFWPGSRKPSWWIVLADDKSNRVVVPPLKISDIPYSRPDADRNYRAFKIQFQCPPNTGLFTWKIYIVSDTFVGEEATTDLPLKVEEPIADDQGSDSVLNIHTPTSSFAIIHSLTQESLLDLYNKLSRKAGTDYYGQRVGPGWLKYEYNDAIWSLDDDSDYTIFVWRRQQHEEDHIIHEKSQLLESSVASTSRSLLPSSPPSVILPRSSMPSGPTLHLHNPKEPMPIPPAYFNASYYMFHPSQAHVPSAKHSPTPSNASTRRSKKGKNTHDNSEDDGIPKFKKEFERFHSENGVRTVMGSIGPVQNVRMLLKSGYRHVYISRKFAIKHGFIPADAVPGSYGYGGLVNIGLWPITLTPSSSQPNRRIAGYQRPDAFPPPSPTPSHTPYSSPRIPARSSPLPSMLGPQGNTKNNRRKKRESEDVTSTQSNPQAVSKTVEVQVYLSEEPHFDVVLGRSFFEKRQIRTTAVDLTDVVCLDTGEKIECELVILKDGRGEIVTVT